MENRRIINHKLILGGALIGALLITTLPVLAYDQKNTHPALTDEIVDFYNLNFPDKKLTNQEKQWLIQGAIEEDIGERPLFHFYDPVFNRGIAHFSSKEWALKPSAQANYYNSQLTGFAAISGDDSANDFSYGRALDDYAKGDRERAFIAFGHTLHLLEDAGVPDHTRADPHPPVLDWGSPYEHEMAKWSPENFQIAKKLFLTREKPVILGNVVDYFDRIANYSNNNFFSKDTISNKEFSNPDVNKTKSLFLNNEERLFIVGNDRNDKEFSLAFVDVKIVGGKKKIIDITLAKPEIGTYILDGYWERLSKEIVLNGAGALNLFLTEAEKAKTEYANRPEQNPNWFARLLGLIGLVDKELTTSDVNGDSEVTQTLEVTNTLVSPSSKVTKTPDTNVTILSPLPSPSKTPTPTPKISTLPSPSLTPEKTEKVNINTANKELLTTLKGIKDAKSDAIIQYRETQGLFQKIEDIMNVSGIGQATFAEIKDLITVGNFVPTPSPAPVYGGGGGSSSSTPTPTPTPTPSSTPTPSPTPEPEGGDTANFGDIVINEIAWMGTSSSSNDEWMELYNTTNQTINLTDWTLKSEDDTPNITLSGNISPLGFFLLERTNEATLSNVESSQIYTGALGNTGENLVLKDIAGTIISQVDGSNNWEINGDGVQIGDNTTKETAQKIENSWVTASPTPKADNQLSTTTFSVVNPQAVTDLIATLNSPLAVIWSAPNPGGFSPASLSYDLRYSVNNFTSASSASWWSAATIVASSSLPNVGSEGASQSVSFDISYQYGQTLYFALKTKLKNCDSESVSEDCQESNASNIAEVSFSVAIDPNSWAMLGKDRYHISFADNILGPGIGATTSWEFDAGVGNTIGQPVISADGNIYFGASDGLSGKLIKLDKEGEQQWEYDTNVSIGTPAVLSDETVYFGRIGAGGFLAFTALNPDGSEKWDYDNASTVKAVAVSQKGEPYFTYSSGTDKLAVLNTDGSAKTIVSNAGLNGFVPVVLDDGSIIATRRLSGNQFFTKYSADGIQLWDVAYTGANGSIQPNPSYDQETGNTYSAIGYDGGTSFGFRMFVIPSDGSVLNTTVIDPVSNGSGATMVSITPDDLLVGLDYSWANPASGSELFSLNKSDLTINWTFQAEGKINQQIAVDNDSNAYFSTQSGHVYSVDSDGQERWHISSGINSVISPILTENSIIWGYGNRIVFVK